MGVELHDFEFRLHSPFHHLKEVGGFIAFVGPQIFRGDPGALLPEEEVEFLLIAEVMEQKGLADARVGGNFAHGTFLVAVLGKYIKSGVDDFLLLFLWKLVEFFVHEIPLLSAILSPAGRRDWLALKYFHLCDRKF